MGANWLRSSYFSPSEGRRTERAYATVEASGRQSLIGVVPRVNNSSLGFLRGVFYLEGMSDANH